MPKDFKTVDHGAHPMDLTNVGPAIQLKPMELHHNSNGSVENEPTFAIVMGVPQADSTRVIGQLSLKMLNEAFEELGYKLTKK